MKPIILNGLMFLFVMTYAATAGSQTTNDEIKKTVSGFFDGISEISEMKIKSFVTDDFSLLEDGEVWNADSLVAVLQPLKTQQFTRTNAFEFIEIELAGNMAWASYHNTATFTGKDRQRKIRWLESVVLERINGNWKIRMMHSTRIRD